MNETVKDRVHRGDLVRARDGSGRSGRVNTEVDPYDTNQWVPAGYTNIGWVLGIYGLTCVHAKPGLDCEPRSPEYNHPCVHHPAYENTGGLDSRPPVFSYALLPSA